MLSKGTFTLFIAIALFAASQANATETCSRIAVINFQEVLVDTNSTKKGEGLRFYLEKDPVAKSYLDKYQKDTEIKLENAILGTAGVGAIFGGLLTSDSGKKQIFLVSGAVMMTLNFLIARTLEVVNEQNLDRAIEEYNKRNLPKIDFQPDQTTSGLSREFNFTITKSWNF